MLSYVLQTILSSHPFFKESPAAYLNNDLEHLSMLYYCYLDFPYAEDSLSKFDPKT
jgi:hypothetical protein